MEGGEKYGFAGSGGKFLGKFFVWVLTFGAGCGIMGGVFGKLEVTPQPEMQIAESKNPI